MGGWVGGWVGGWTYLLLLSAAQAFPRGSQEGGFFFLFLLLFLLLLLVVEYLLVWSGLVGGWVGGLGREEEGGLNELL